MLQTTKSKTFTGQVMIEDEMAVYVSTTIEGDKGVSSSVSISVQNEKLYRENKEACRKGIEDYLQELWQIEDGK